MRLDGGRSGVWKPLVWLQGLRPLTMLRRMEYYTPSL